MDEYLLNRLLLAIDGCWSYGEYSEYCDECLETLAYLCEFYPNLDLGNRLQPVEQWKIEGTYPYYYGESILIPDVRNKDA